ncbi:MULTISPECIES: MarR family winged helix-turn-helix transcriptional regulator [Pantoea]|uniref:MarR family transcriptional regulator n=2 Tax=Pantoea TaxID=53335 RepID=A0A0U3U8C9_9GAMM|nr:MULTISPECIES: MarR family transcriptional regulator [Pantoea]ALV92387.1 MarR family transcriptional regulator [Pantoea vagans]KHJ65859.1 MarR family transcriptional regulator [Pantoea rodasii]MDI9221918.1 MarR family transcriptional regulator [Pantoea sp. EA-12]
MSDLNSAAAALRSINGKLARRLRESAPPADLTWSQVSVLGFLVRDGAMTVTELAAQEGVRSQSMGATVASLQAQGLIQGEADPHDGRKTRYHPTESCLQLIAANRAQRDDWLLRNMATSLTPAEQKTLLAAIPLLQRIADQ